MKYCALILFSLCTPARADFFGGDLPLLASLVANTAQQLTKLQQIMGANQQTLALLKDVNRGIHHAIALVKSQNGTLDPGVLSNLGSASEILAKIETLYGKIPNSPQSESQAVVDTTVAQSIHLHNEAFRYAQKLDPEVERLKHASQTASPGTAQKLTAHSMGVLIHATNQVLRTNAAILKVQSEQLAIENRKQKARSHHLRALYQDTSKTNTSLKSNFNLPKL